MRVYLRGGNTEKQEIEFLGVRKSARWNACLDIQNDAAELKLRAERKLGGGCWRRLWDIAVGVPCIMARATS